MYYKALNSSNCAMRAKISTIRYKSEIPMTPHGYSAANEASSILFVLIWLKLPYIMALPSHGFNIVSFYISNVW